MQNDIDVRKRILEIARPQFLRYGFRKATMSEIAAELGMSKKTVYEFFPSKENLLRGVINEMQEEMEANTAALIGSAQFDFVQKFKLLMEHCAVFYSKFNHNFHTDIQRNVPEVWKCCDEFRRERVRSHMLAFLHEGIEAGYFRRDINEQVVMMVFSAAMQSLLTPEVLAQLPLSMSQVFETIIKVMFEGLLTERARKNQLSSEIPILKLEEQIYG